MQCVSHICIHSDIIIPYIMSPTIFHYFYLYCLFLFYVTGKKDISEDLKSKQPKFGHLMSLLEPLEDRWKEIGDALRIPTDLIQKNNDSLGNNYKLHEVLDWWRYYNRHTQLKFTWKTVIDVIKDPINDQVVAEAIHNFLTSDDVYSQYCP